MNAIKYIFEDISFAEKTIQPKYKFVNFAKQKNKQIKLISFIFCSDKYLQKINYKYLKHHDLTDVITFEYNETNDLEGDVFISIERVKENSKTFNVKFKAELARVMIHGVLHLMDYNDKSENEKSLMRKLENEFLKNCI